MRFGGFVCTVQLAVAVVDLLAGDGGDAVAGDDDADEVDGVGGGDGDDGVASRGVRAARRESTASGRANCSPPKPVTKRPPRTSPRASRRRRMPRRSRHLGALDSRARRSRKRTP